MLTPLKIYHQKANCPDFWERKWRESLNGSSLSNYYQNYQGVSISKEIFEKYLLKEEKILEAGCGLGSWVYLLKKKGYDIEGVDFAQNTINFVKSKFPQMPIKLGNVLNLDYPDNYFKGYISWGVVEHWEEGPGKILKEAARVLKKQGVMILSIPYSNPLRKLKNLLGFYQNQKGDFYQYLFTRNEIIGYIKEAGFEIIKTYPNNPVKGLRDEIFGMRKIHQSFIRKQNELEGKENGFLLRIITNSYPMRFLFSHSIIIIAKKI